MTAVIIILSVLLLAVVGVVSLEAAPPFIEMLQRRGMGSLNGDEWFEAASSAAAKWCEKGLPDVPLSENSRFVVFEKIRGAYSSDTIRSWQQASVMLGLERAGLYEYCSSEKYIDENTGQWKMNIDRVDYSMLAYAILSNSLTDKDFVKPAMDSMANFLTDKFNSYGSIPYSGDENHRYVDTIGMVCPFLMKYGVTYNYPEKIKIATDLIKEYAREGVNDSYGLPVHCYDAKTKAPLGIYSWGRGCGWWATGLADSFEVLNECEDYIEEKTIILKNMLILAQRILKYQNPDGSFGRNLFLNSGADSSASAMLSYFMAYAGSLCKKPDYTESAKAAMNYIYSVTRKNGVVDYSQGDTMGIGFYSQSSIVLPATQGFALRAYVILNK